MSVLNPGAERQEGPRDPARDRPPLIRAAHLQKRAAVYVRQSSMEQVRDATGSAAAQRALADLPKQWGWHPDDILVIDEDQGKSGTSASARTGFQELLALVEAGEVSVVLARDFSRLSRDPVDAARFLKAAERASILFYANGRLYDPASDNLAEVFGLHLEGLLGWWDNATRKQRLAAARQAKAQQGLAVSPPPIGYVKGGPGQWVKDSDVEVQKAIRLIFERALQLGSVGAVVHYMRQHNLRFPRRRRGQLTWGFPSRARVYSVLTNPLYTGTYVYGRVRILPGTGTAARDIERRPESDWISTPEHHAPYVTPEEWSTISAQLAARRPTVQPIVGKGGALLQGRVRCGQCARRLQTKYWAKDGQARAASYMCRPVNAEGEPEHTITCSARLVDQAVIGMVLAALTPVEIDAALTVITDANREQATITRTQARQRQDAEDDVDRARRSYEMAGSSHPRVSAHLLQQFEDALARLDDLKRAQARLTRQAPVSVTREDAVALQALTQDIRRLWDAGTTTNEDRKRLLRIVLSEVVVLAATAEGIELEVAWTGGLRQRLVVPRPKAVDALVIQLHHEGQDPNAIAEHLNAQGLTTAKGTPFKRSTIYAVLDRHGLRRKDERREILLLIRQMVIENVPRKDMLVRLTSESPKGLGPWTHNRVSQIISGLRRGVAGIPPLPASRRVARVPGRGPGSTTVTPDGP
jgi:DNA invertase Pin-like site-specific DNA recombinase